MILKKSRINPTKKKPKKRERKKIENLKKKEKLELTCILQRNNTSELVETIG